MCVVIAVIGEKKSVCSYIVVSVERRIGNRIGVWVKCAGDDPLQSHLVCL